MRECFPNHPEIFGIFKYALQESFNIADTPHLPPIELRLIVDRISNQFRTGLIVHDLLLLRPVDMIQAKLLLLQLCEVIPESYAIIPLLFFIFVTLSLLCYFGGLAIDPAKTIVN
jgi:hypothetical protein